MSYTFAIIKPTAIANDQQHEIMQCIQDAGFVIVDKRECLLSQEQSEALYAEHAQRDFFGALCEYMRSGNVVVMKLYHPHKTAWCEWRAIMGATDPAEAAEGTIRKQFGVSRRENAVHGSDSAESATRELALFFDAAPVKY